jgi:hypothetical protein
MSHPALTDWMSPPKLEARLASHTARKIPCLNGAKGDECSVMVLSVETAASSLVDVGAICIEKGRICFVSDQLHWTRIGVETTADQHSG